MKDLNPHMLRRRWMISVCACPDLSDAAKVVAYRLSEYWNAKSGDAYPSLSTLAKAVAKSVRAVQRAIDQLCGRGFISKSPPRRGRASNTYRLNLARDAASPSETLKSSRRRWKPKNPDSKRSANQNLQNWLNSVAVELGGPVEGQILLQSVSEIALQNVFWKSVNGDWDIKMSARAVFRLIHEQDDGDTTT